MSRAAWLRGDITCGSEIRLAPNGSDTHAHATAGWKRAYAAVQWWRTMTRNEITELVVLHRLSKGLSWQELADAIERPVVWTTAALLGQHPIPAGLGAVLVEMLGLADAVPVLGASPMRGGLPNAVPTDPTIYRFYEALQVYGRRSRNSSTSNSATAS